MASLLQASISMSKMRIISSTYNRSVVKLSEINSWYIIGAWKMAIFILLSSDWLH